MFYSRSLRFALAHTVMLTIGCAGVIVGSYFCYQALGATCSPPWMKGASFWII